MTKPTVPSLLFALLRPRRRALAVILAGMLVQTAMSLAVPWPLKIVIDTVVGNQRQPEWINSVLTMLGGTAHKSQIAVAAGIFAGDGQGFVRRFVLQASDPFFRHGPCATSVIVLSPSACKASAIRRKVPKRLQTPAVRAARRQARR